MTTVITAEPRVYGPGSDYSYFQDIALTAPGISAAGTREAAERLVRYDAELHAAIDNPTSDAERREGQRAASLMVERRRGDFGLEQRTGATSTTLAGFTTPVYLTDEWAAFRSPNKSFTDQTMQLPLPEYGLQINIPSFTSASSTGQQTEGGGVAEGDPSGLNEAINLQTLAGQVTISQQLHDRGGMTGLDFDRIIVKQMSSQLDASFDSYVLTQALANAGTVTGTSFSIANFYQDLAKARELLSDTAGTRLVGTHLFSTSDLFGYITRQVDATTNRPILTPDSSALVLASQMNDPQWNSWTGVHMGQLRWHTDDNIAPAAGGTTTQIVVARPQEIYTFNGPNISFAYPETGATTLSVVVGLRCYVAAAIRFPKSVAVISGTAYPTSLV